MLKFYLAGLNKMTVAKFDKFIVWLEENWQKCDGLGTTTKEEWRTAAYGIRRLKGMLSFMNSGDWSRQRMPEFIEYINKMDGIRAVSYTHLTLPTNSGV